MTPCRCPDIKDDKDAKDVKDVKDAKNDKPSQMFDPLRHVGRAWDVDITLVGLNPLSKDALARAQSP